MHCFALHRVREVLIGFYFALLRPCLGVIVLCLFTIIAFALDFPSLTGRVVDQARVMSAQSRSDITAKSKSLEEKSGTQLVVATVSSLQGGDIETYANELFRSWKLGQADKNNGVLLLVAPNEHKVRIEVGYGLEGTLTDALSSMIISSAIIPRFKTGDFSGGIERGVDGIISVLSGDAASWQPQADCRLEDASGDFDELFNAVLLRGCFFFVLVLHPHQRRTFPKGHYVDATAARSLCTLRRILGRRQLSAAALLRMAIFRAAAARPAAAAHRGAGDAFHAAGSRGGFGRDPRGGETHLRTARLCPGAFSSAYAYVSILWASVLALAAPLPLILFHAVERATDFLLQLAVFIVAGSLVLFHAAAVGAGSARGEARASASRGARAIRRARYQPDQKSHRRADLCVAGEHYARIIADEGIAAKVVTRNGRPRSML